VISYTSDTKRVILQSTIVQSDQSQLFTT